MNRYSIFIFILLLTPAYLTGQNQVNLPDAFKSGNAEGISQNFDRNTDLVILDNDEIVNKKQGKNQLEKFFKSHEPVNFKVLHSGESGTSMRYTIGILETKKGNFRISYYIRDTNGKQLIQQLTIDEE